MQIRKSIIQPITFVFIILFFILIILLVFSIYQNMLSMYKLVNIERINGISNVIRSTVEHELESIKYSELLLSKSIKEQYTAYNIPEDIAHIIENQTYSTHKLDLIVITDSDLNVVFLNDKHDILSKVNFGNLTFRNDNASDYFIARISGHNLIFGQLSLNLPDGNYIAVVGFNSNIDNIVFDNDTKTHFRVLNQFNKTILTDLKYDAFVNSKKHSYNYLKKNIIIQDNLFKLELFYKQDPLDVFGYTNVFLTIGIIIILIIMYCFTTTFLIKYIIIPLHKLKKTIIESTNSLPLDLSSGFNLNEEKNEISCLIGYFNFFISKIQLYAEDAESHRQKLKNIINSVGVGIIEIDANLFTINDINDCALRMLGLTYDECIGTHCYKYLCKRESCSDGINCLANEAIVSPYTIECSILNVKTGITFPVLKSLVKIPDIESTLILVTFINITDLKNKEEELKRAVGCADRATLGKTIMLGNVSHDIKNELTVLKGNAEKIHNDDTLNAEQKKLINVVIDSADTISTAVKLMQERTLLETGQSKLSLQSIDLCDIMDRLSRANFIKCKDKNIEFKYNGILSGNERLDKLLVNADSSKLNAVLSNLLDNAIKFTNVGYVSCSVVIISETDTSFDIKFRIKDTGIGISSDVLESIFKIYEQANENIQSLYGGVGVGLSICQHYVKMMGGEIEVDSVLEEGSVFSFNLSLEKGSVEQFELDKIDHFEKNIDQLQVIVAEDSKAIQEVINTKLEQLNCEVTIVANGRDVIKRIHEEYFDILFLDIRMPIMGGMEVVQIIRDEKFRIPIIALTANSSETDIEKYIEAGFDGCVSKPVSDVDLNDIIMKYKNRQLIDIDYVQKNYKTSEWFLQVLNTVKDEFNLNIEMLILFDNDSNYSNLDHYLKASHSIKSISSQMGMESVRHIAHILETKFANGINFQDANRVHDLITLLQIQFDKSLKYYDDYLKT